MKDSDVDTVYVANALRSDRGLIEVTHDREVKGTKAGRQWVTDTFSLTYLLCPSVATVRNKRDNIYINIENEFNIMATSSHFDIQFWFGFSLLT